MRLAIFALMLSACTPPHDEVPSEAPPRFEGAVELVAGEPVFEAEIDALIARGVPAKRARERLRGYSLLASEARSAPSRVSERELAWVRRRAAVQLYLRDLREGTEPPSEAILRARHEESGDPRPFEEVAAELEEAVEIERTFAHIVDRITARSDELSPVVIPEALPDLRDLHFGGEEAP